VDDISAINNFSALGGTPNNGERSVARELKIYGVGKGRKDTSCRWTIARDFISSQTLNIVELYAIDPDLVNGIISCGCLNYCKESPPP
jgi:hypothetical protein